MTTKSLVGILLILALVITGCTPFKAASFRTSEPDYWPTAGWQNSPPEAQGMDSELLAQMLEEISANNTRIHSVLIVRNGYMVTEAYFHPYTRATKMHVQSITKSVIGALLGIAIEEGYIKSENQKRLSFFPDREFANPGKNKDEIRLKHLLSMSSGFPCQEFSESGQSMEQTSDWVQFMLDLPVDASPGTTFGYCNGNPHLLSAIIQEKTGMITREFANQKLFKPLGIPVVEERDWETDPEGFSNGGYGLFLRPADLAKFAFLYLQDGKWEDGQILPKRWVADSTVQSVQKPEGPGYGYLWTVYPQSNYVDHYAALGLAGQQIHIYPSRNLIVIVTAELEAYAEATEIERMLNEFILPAIQSDSALPDNPEAVSHLQAAVETARNPVKSVAQLPAIANEVSGKLYRLEENPNDWKTFVIIFEPGANTARVSTNEYNDLDEIGLDNIYRRAALSQDQYMMRGHWVDDHTFLIDFVALPLGNNLTYNIQLKYSDKDIEISIEQPIFAGEPMIIKGTS